MDDSRLVDLFLARDESAISGTAEKYGQKLLRLAKRLLGSTDDAEECINDAYLRAWDSIPPNEPRQYLFPFLARIARQNALNRVRSSAAAKRSALVVELTAEMEECLPSSLDASSGAEKRELMGLINAFLARLPEEKRIIFLKRYWYFEPVTSIAVTLGISQSKVKTTLFRTREKLKAYLEEEGYPY